jgi:hypothetical protein
MSDNSNRVYYTLNNTDITQPVWDRVRYPSVNLRMLLNTIDLGSRVKITTITGSSMEWRVEMDPIQNIINAVAEGADGDDIISMLQNLWDAE